MPRPKKTDTQRVKEGLEKTINDMKKMSQNCKTIITYTQPNSIESKFIGDIFRALVDNRKRLEIILQYLDLEGPTFYMTATGELKEATAEQKVKLLISKMDNDNFYKNARYSESDCLHSLQEEN